MKKKGPYIKLFKASDSKKMHMKSYYCVSRWLLLKKNNYIDRVGALESK